MKSLSVYWWRPKDQSQINLGDELGRAVTEKVSGRPVQWAPLHECEIISIGSILGWPYRTEYISQRKRVLTIWGAGLMMPVPVKRHEMIRIAAVRGLLTRCILDVPGDTPIGDPGLLASDVWEPAPVKKYRVGIIPHHSQTDHELIKFCQDNVKGSVVVDVRDPDLTNTMATISACERIIASSLHGLIIADSYKIPNLWIDTDPVHDGKSWKFYDYFSSVGRDRFYQIDVVKNLAELNTDDLDLYSISQHKNVDSAKQAIWSSFPKKLMASSGAPQKPAPETQPLGQAVQV